MKRTFTQGFILFLFLFLVRSLGAYDVGSLAVPSPKPRKQGTLFPESAARQEDGERGIVPLKINNEVYTIVLDNIPLRDLLLTIFSGIKDFTLILSPDISGSVSLKVYRVTLGEILRSLVNLEKIAYIYNETTKTLNVFPKKAPEKKIISVLLKNVPESVLRDIITKFGLEGRIKMVTDKKRGVVLLQGNKIYMDQVEHMINLYVAAAHR